MRGTIYCGECDGRLIYTRAKGRAGGIYEYFVCAGRQQGTCNQPHHRVQAVEQAIEDVYAENELSEQRRQQIRTAVRAYVQTLDQHTGPERQQIEENLTRLSGQEKKLLQAHYDDNITPELFAAEQQRIRRERIAAQQRQEELQVDHGQTLKTLDTALSLTDEIQTAYILAKPTTRRIFNQAIYDRILIDRETIASTEHATPFAEIHALEQELPPDAPTGPRAAPDAAGSQLGAWTLNSQGPARRARTGHGTKRTPTAITSRGGSNVECMVRPSGLEPPRGNLPTRPSTLRVYQFRHGRRGASIAPGCTAPRQATAAARVASVLA